MLQIYSGIRLMSRINSSVSEQSLIELSWSHEHVRIRFHCETDDIDSYGFRLSYLLTGKNTVYVYIKYNLPVETF